jgi:hypothetical protein
VDETYARVVPEADATSGERSVLRLVVAVMVVLLVAVGAVAAVAGRDDDVDPVALLTGAPDAVRDAKTAHLSMTMSMHSKGISFDMSVKGATDFATQETTMTMSFLGIDLEMVSDGKTIYVHIPDGGELPGAAKPWVAAPLEQAGSSLGGADSATGMIDALRGIGKTVDDLGTEEVNGVTAHHFHTSFSIKDAIAAAPESQRAEVEQGLQQLGALGDDEMPVDAWITDDGIPVRQVMTFEGSNGVSALAGMQMKVTVDLSDFGAPVKVEVPPTDQVQAIDPSEIGSLFGGLGAQMPAA